MTRHILIPMPADTRHRQPVRAAVPAVAGTPSPGSAVEVGRDAAAATGLRRDDAIRRIATATFTPALVLRVAGISGSAAMRRSAPAALAHSVLNVGGSSATPEPGSGPSANRRVPVRPARVPRLTALAGAGPAAMAACRNPATVAA